MPREQPPPPASPPPATFHVGAHEVVVGGRPGQWAVSVDGSALSHSYGTRADAWEAGVREADRLDRQRPA